MKAALFECDDQRVNLGATLPKPLEQAPHAPWTVEEWPEFPPSNVIYHHSIRELHNNSFVFGPSNKVLVILPKRGGVFLLLVFCCGGRHIPAKL